MQKIEPYVIFGDAFDFFFGRVGIFGLHSIVD